MSLESTEAKNGPTDPVAELVHDHRVILSVVGAFEGYAQALRQGKADQHDMIRFCVFLREFGSILHHEREEHIAIAAMSLHGFRPGGVPRQQLHDEHQAERSLLLKVIRFALAPHELTVEQCAAAADAIETYCQGLAHHLAYEEEHLYPAMQRTLTPDELASVARKLRRFDVEHNESGQLDWLLEQAEQIEEKYGRP